MLTQVNVLRPATAACTLYRRSTPPLVPRRGRSEGGDQNTGWFRPPPWGGAPAGQLSTCSASAGGTPGWGRGRARAGGERNGGPEQPEISDTPIHEGSGDSEVVVPGALTDSGWSGPPPAGLPPSSAATCEAVCAAASRLTALILDSSGPRRRTSVARAISQRRRPIEKEDPKIRTHRVTTC